MGRSRRDAKPGSHESEKPSGTVGCPECNPPEDLRRRLRGEIGRHRYRHYATFATAAGLDQHLRTWARPGCAPERGYSFDEWLSGVLAWHAQYLTWIAEDERRNADQNLGARETEIS